MKLLAFCLALGALPGFSETRQASVAPIFIYTQFQQESSNAVVDALQDEMEGIMSPMGLRFTWRSLASHGNETAVELAVVTFKGRCTIAGLQPVNKNPGALGWTHVSDGVILPFADVDCDRIRDFIQKELLLLPSDDREEAYGRALGRVLAHELYHIFANTAQHGSCGVGKSAYTVKELLSDEFQFEQKESTALRNSKARNVLEAPVNAGSPPAL